VSRFNIYAVYNHPTDGTLTEDHDCTIGWDSGLNTFFFQAGHVASSETDEPVIWIGTEHSQYRDLDHFLQGLKVLVKSPEIEDLYDDLAAKSDN
jgi:hypothetical protein